MKKSIFLAAVAALVLAGCAKNETFVKVTNEDAVSFGAYSGRTLTKAGSTDDMNLESLKQHGFGVFATYSATDDYETLPKATNDFMYNQLVNHNGTDWTYSPIKYWPNPTNGQNANDQKVSFFAYAPYAEPTATETVGVTDFSIDATTGHNLVHYAFSPDQPNVDLMWGYKTKTVDNTDPANPVVTYTVNNNLTRSEERVHFKFMHLLAKLGGSQEDSVNGNLTPDDPGYVANGLVVKANAETITPTNDFGTANGTKITVSKIVIGSAPEIDKLTNLPVTDIDGNAISYATSAINGTLDLYTGVFDVTDAISNIQFKQTITNKIDDPATTEDESNPDSELADRIAEPASFSEFGALPKGVTSTAVNVYKDESNPIILVPGTKPVVDIEITYIVRTYDEKLGTKKYTEVPQTVFGRIKFDEIKKNTKYNIVMILGLNDVKFSAEVEDWATGVVGQVWHDDNNDGVQDANEWYDINDTEIGLPDNLPLLDLVSSTQAVTIDGTGNANLNNVYNSAAGDVTITSVTPNANITLDAANNGLILTGVEKGTYVIELASAGDATHAPAARTLTLTVIGAANNFDLASTKSVTVDATDHDGETEALYTNAKGTVTLESATKNYIDAAGFTFDDSTKKVTLDNVAPGEYVLTFKAAGDEFHEEAVNSLTLTVTE